jgi:hypothetical protein
MYYGHKRGPSYWQHRFLFLLSLLLEIQSRHLHVTQFHDLQASSLPARHILYILYPSSTYPYQRTGLVQRGPRRRRQGDHLGRTIWAPLSYSYYSCHGYSYCYSYCYDRTTTVQFCTYTQLHTYIRRKDCWMGNPCRTFHRTLPPPRHRVRPAGALLLMLLLLLLLQLFLRL